MDSVDHSAFSLFLTHRGKRGGGRKDTADEALSTHREREGASLAQDEI